MHTNSAILAILPCIFAILLICIYGIVSSKPSRKTSVLDIKLLLNPPQISLLQNLRSRAHSNSRLIRALGLTNTFVNPDPTIHNIFVSQAKRMISDAQRKGWTNFRDIAYRASEIDLSQNLLRYDHYIQSVTLRVVLVGIMGIDEDLDSLNADDIAGVAKDITDLWNLSKKPEPIPNHILPQLNERLRRLIRDQDTFPNPLDYVIPAWETLWRVVATTIAHIHNDASSSQTFKEFFDSPTENQFRSSMAGFSVKNVIDEDIRLHPPSKHIARCHLRDGFLFRILERIGIRLAYEQDIADVQSVQRSPVWDNANVFDPSRHSQSRLQAAQKETLQFAFGFRPLQCIAASWAPMASAVISASILSSLENKGYEIIAGVHIGERTGWEDWFVGLKDDIYI